MTVAIAPTTNQAKPSRTTGSARVGGGPDAGTRVRASLRNAVPRTTDDAARVGRAMRSAKPPKVRPVAENTSRLVRFDTGRRLDDALASCVVASSGGSGRTSRCATSCTTTGVKSTAVASRLISTVTSTATAETATTSRRELRLRSPIHAPAARNRPASRATSASTNTAARNASVEARRSTVSPTSSIPTRPTPTTSSAAVPATSTSGTRPHATSASTAARMSRLPAVPTAGSRTRIVGALDKSG